MTEEVKTFIDNLATGDNANGEAFKTALRQKVGDGLDNKKKRWQDKCLILANLYDEAETFSNFKRNLNFEFFDRDGNVISQNDGQADIDLTTDENK